MKASIAKAVPLLLLASSVVEASPILKRGKPLDLHGHRGGRGEVVEETLEAMAHSLVSGAHTLEFDIGITKDGHPVVWHDENIDTTKCEDTGAVQENDPEFPYVGKYIANLTLAQVKSLDCGKQRLADYPLQQTYAGARIATLPELFEFVQCVDKKGFTKFNIESKLSPPTPNTTVGAQQFVDTMTKVFQDYGVMEQVTFQSFAWETLILVKKAFPQLVTSALIDSTTTFSSETLEDTDPETLSPWLAGVNVSSFEGTLPEKIAAAAHSIGANVISPAHGVSGTGELGDEGYIAYTNKTMVDAAHELGIQVLPWTTNSLTTLEKLVWEDNVDGVITDYPEIFAKWFERYGYEIGEVHDTAKVKQCLEHSNTQAEKRWYS